MGDLVFFLSLALLLTHEMDAVQHREWRILPLTAWLDDQTGYRVFTLAHVPLYALLLWALVSAGQDVRVGARVVLDVFCMVHVLLHLAFRRHPAYTFSGPLSWGLIVGAGVCGALDLALHVLAR
jgi:hypothetical protein